MYLINESKITGIFAIFDYEHHLVTWLCIKFYDIVAGQKL